MKIVSLELDNFRRFRSPLRLDGFIDGLNVVVEPNETGKSTLLEALRAALFIKHSAKTDLTRSYCPFGDEVAPKVAIEFEVRGDRWHVEKQFLRSSKVHVSGPPGRFESDAAEEQLQTLLGFQKGNNKGSDPETRGSLGLLWVEQASALKVDAPNRLVRDNVRSALESEVGAITGGRRFELVRQSIEDAYAELRTIKQGKSTDRLLAAETRAAAARQRRESAETLARAHETTLAELDAARATRRRIERELGDEEQVRLRERLVADLKLGEAAAEKLNSANARYEVVEAKVERLGKLVDDVTAAEKALGEAESACTRARADVDAHRRDHDDVATQEAACAKDLVAARAARTEADAAVGIARRARARQERSAAIERARDRLTSLDALNKELAERERAAVRAIGSKDLAELARLDKAVVGAAAVVRAGAVRVEVAGRDGTAIRVNGEQVRDGALDITVETRIEVGDHASLRIIPAGTGSATATLSEAERALAAALAAHGVESHAAALARDADAKAASEAIKALTRQIATLCVADPPISLEAGAAQLRAFLATVEDEDADDHHVPDLAAAEASGSECLEAERVAIGRHNAGVAALRGVEKRAAELGGDLVGAERDLANARARLNDLTRSRAKPDIEAELAQAREELAERLRSRTAAEQAVGAFDVDRLKLRIENIDKAAAGAGEQRLALIEKIAGLEATIAGEGAKGLAGQLAEAREEEEAAREAVARLAAEANTLELLRSTLRDAQETASRTFLGPVTSRAVRYVRRILPDCDVTFSEELGLTSITRSGVSEGCGDLSRGTQEQLAVLTRLAFADMLLDKGEPVSLILDDPLVYSDDARLELMTDILASAAERMQVILLTCRERAFRHVGGKRISVSV